MDSAFPTLLITLIYPCLVWKIGPKLMKNREAFNVDRLLTLYNFGQIIANSYIVIQMSSVMFRKFNIYCNLVDYSDDQDAHTLLNAFYLYFILKIVDTLDTVSTILLKYE